MFKLWKTRNVARSDCFRRSSLSAYT